MNEYLITYDLTNHNNCTGICGAISGLDTNCWPCLHSTWVAHTSLSAEQIANRLRPHITPADKLFIVKLSGDWSSVGLPECSADWLQHNL